MNTFQDSTLEDESRVSSVGIATGLEAGQGGSRVRFPTGAGNFSHHCVQNGPKFHPTSYPMGTGGCFPGSKAAGP
jgi:hypothetical protein